MSQDLSKRDALLSANQRLYKAAEVGNVVDLQQALDDGADTAYYQTSNKNTPLHEAVLHDRFDAAKLLLMAGADPNIQTIRGYTPLHLAAKMTHPDIVEILLDYGADPDIRTISGTGKLGDTVLHEIVTFRQNNGIAHRLLDAGADPLLENGEGKKPYEKISASISRSVPVDRLLSALEAHEAMPRISDVEKLTKAKLFEPDNQKNSMLDNPHTWRHWSEVVEKLKVAGEAPLSKKELLQQGKNEMSFLERAIKARALGKVVKQLNLQGESITVAEIAALPTGKDLMQSHQIARALFTPANTLNWGKDKIRANALLLGGSAREAIPNFQRLLLNALPTFASPMHGRQ